MTHVPEFPFSRGKHKEVSNKPYIYVQDFNPKPFIETKNEWIQKNRNPFLVSKNITIVLPPPDNYVPLVENLKLNEEAYITYAHISVQNNAGSDRSVMIRILREPDLLPLSIILFLKVIPFTTLNYSVTFPIPIKVLGNQKVVLTADVSDVSGVVILGGWIEPSSI